MGLTIIHEFKCDYPKCSAVICHMGETICEPQVPLGFIEVRSRLSKKPKYYCGMHTPKEYDALEDKKNKKKVSG